MAKNVTFVLYVSLSYGRKKMLHAISPASSALSIALAI